MTLINRMLADLEARKQAAGAGETGERLFRDLRSAGARRRWARRALPVTVLAALLAALTGFAAGTNWEAAELRAHVRNWGQALQARFAATSAPSMPVEQETARTAPVIIAALHPPAKTPSAFEADKRKEEEPLPAVKPQSAKPTPARSSEVSSKPAPVQKTAAPVSKPSRAAAERSPAKVEPVAVQEETPPALVDKTMLALTAEERAESAFREAARALAQGHRQEAEKMLRACLEHNALHAQARETLVGLLLQQGHDAEAEQWLLTGRRLVPQHYRFSYLLARLYADRGARREALELLEEVRPRAGLDAEFIAFLAALYQQLGRHADAATAYSQALTIEPSAVHSWLGLAISLDAGGNWNGAYQAYQRAILTRAMDDKLQRYATERAAVMKERHAARQREAAAAAAPRPKSPIRPES